MRNPSGKRSGGVFVRLSHGRTIAQALTHTHRTYAERGGKTWSKSENEEKEPKGKRALKRE